MEIIYGYVSLYTEIIYGCIDVIYGYKTIYKYTWSYENRVGKPNFLCNFSQLLLSNISLFTVLFTADFDFFAAFWLGICVEVDVDIWSRAFKGETTFNKLNYHALHDVHSWNMTDFP